MTDLNEAGRAHARALIAAGKVDKTSAWDWDDARDGDALLGAGGQDWTTYSQAHLGVDRSAADKTKARWKYPFQKNGKVYRSALEAIRQRSAQQGDNAVYAAAGELLEKIDGSAPKGADLGAPQLKAAKFEFKFTDDTGGDPPGTFEGYGSVFNNEDDGGDMMMPGAFDKTLAQYSARGRMPKMLLNHGGLGDYFASPSPEDMLPIGKWNALSPDSNGLEGKGRLINLDTESGKKIYGAMKEGELSDMSIMYIPREVVRGTKPNEPRRQLKSVDLLEMGPVTFAMNRLAAINAVKNAHALLGGADVHDVRDLEAALREGGLSRSDAARAVAVFKSWSQRDAGDDPSQELRDAATADDLARLAALIRA